MKVKIYPDEFYPFYIICGDNETSCFEIEISEEKLKEFKRIFHEFYEMQDEIGRLLKERKTKEVKE